MKFPATLFLFLRTLQPLRAGMVWARLWLPVRARFYKPPRLPAVIGERVKSLPPLFLPPLPEADSGNAGNRTFTFSNKTHQFAGSIKWNFLEEGLLWNYHLNSFMWLERQEKPDVEINKIVQSRAALNPKSGTDGYPTSRRLRHLLRYVLMQPVRHPAVVEGLWQDAHRLFILPEKHLGANHLLENYLSLWMAGMVFGHAPFLNAAEKVLRRELQEQFLADGAHYERSTHYTAQLLGGLLRCLATAQALHFSPAENALLWLCRQIIARGLGWLSQMQLPGGQMPAFGDAQRELWPAIEHLAEAAGSLGISAHVVPLSHSGYRVLETSLFSLRINAGTAAPAFQPGHSHADALSFTLCFRGLPLITDAGISTYERDARRQWERSTAAHNTVEVQGKNSAEVWAAFRMGRRALVHIVAENVTEVVAAHSGYRHLGLLHQRRFTITTDTVEIEDTLTGGNFGSARFRLHFLPGVVPELQGTNTLLAGGCTLTFTGLEGAKLESYSWAAGFNETKEAFCFTARFGACTAAVLFKAAPLCP